MGVIDREQEKTLYELKEFLISVISNAPYGIVAFDLGGEVTMTNALAVEYLGQKMSVNRFVGKSILELIKEVPLLAGTVESYIERGRKPFDLPSVQINKRFMSIKGRLISNGTILMIEDITAQKKAEAELHRANIKLRELDLVKSMFIASMSHELRTPLNSIIGFTGIILQGLAGDITDEQRKQLMMVKSSANHLLSLINDVIDVSKIEAGKVELSIGRFDLSALLGEVKSAFEPDAEQKGIILSLETAGGLFIRSDERRTKQVIMNLVSNAVKFTDGGKIEIKAVKGDGVVEVSVRDTGIGMAREDLKELFKAFSRIRAEGIAIKEGTGLGLYLSQKIAELLGGSIRVESDFGRGSEFTFTLPFEDRGEA